MSSALRYLVLFSFVFVMFYAMMPQLDFAYHIIFLTFLLSNALLIIMVLAILKDPNPSTKKFDDYFYEDVKVRRNN